MRFWTAAALTAALGSALAWSQGVEDFRLPAKSVFPTTMPRYPNAWFYVDVRLAKSHDAAVKLVTSRLRETMKLPEFFPPFDNPEGCDYEVHIEHLQPWLVRARRAEQHAHSFHMRYYYSMLRGPELVKVRLGTRDYFRFAASVHYEVEHHNPNHADVEACPICGRTGEYESLQGNLVERVHDPLGLELLLTGKIRGEVVKFEDWKREPMGSVETLRSSFKIRTHVFPGGGERNTERIGIIVMEAK